MFEIRVHPLGGSTLVRDYLAGREPASGFYNGSPFELESFRRQWAHVGARFGRAERETAAAALRPASPRAAERLARWVERGGAVVTTGQQAGLLGGPLYTLYKTISAIRLARFLEDELGVLVLPVFWSASEDHDWAEVDHTFVLDRDDEVRRLTVGTLDPRPLPVAERRLDPSIETALCELAELLEATEDVRDLLESIRGAYRPGRSMGAAFADLVAGLFARFDLLLADAADPALKRASLPALLAEAADAQGRAALLAERTARLRGAGYGAQVALLPGATNLFYHAPEGRERLYTTRGERWTTRESGHAFSRVELEALLAAEPTRFSPNVFLRPIVESTVFPVLAYVAGPGEAAYYAQLEPLYGTTGLRMPVIYPRLSATLIEGRVGRALEALGLDASEVVRPRHELLGELTRRTLPVAVTTELAALREAVAHGYRRLIDAADAVDPTLAGPLGASRNAALAELARNERKIVAHAERRDRTLAARLDRVRAHLYPCDAPQERVLNAIPFLARDSGLLDRLLDLVPLPERAGVG